MATTKAGITIMATAPVTVAAITPITPITAITADMGTERLARLRLHARRPWPALWWALGLTLCLLLAQHAGLRHRIDHGVMRGWPLANAAAEAATSASADDHASDTFGNAKHSCVLFDGAAAGDLSCGTPTMPALSHGMPFLPPGITWRWPHLPPQRAFLTRAPPLRFALS